MAAAGELMELERTLKETWNDYRSVQEQLRDLEQELKASKQHQQADPTEQGQEEVKRLELKEQKLQQKEQSLLDLLNKLEEKNMVLHSSGDILKQLQQLLEAQSKRDKQELLDAVSGARTEMSNAMTELLVHFKQLEQRQEARGDVMMQLLMALMGQQLKPTACSLKSAEYRDPVIAAYNVARLVDGKKQLLCMVSDRYFPADDVTAGHIMRVDWAGLAGHLDVVIHSPRNIIFMHKRIEQAFDRQEWCLLVQPDESLKIEVLNPKLLQPRSPRKSEADLMEELWDAAAARAKRLLMVGEPRDAASERGTEEALCWQDLHGKCLVMPPDAAADARPYKRCVALHAWAAVHTAEGNGWKAKDEVQVPLEGWQSPGADQQLLVQLLTDAQTLATLVYDASQGSDARSSAVTTEDSFTKNSDRED